MVPNCFNTYYQPMYVYISRISELAFSNSGELSFKSIGIVTIYKVLTDIFKIETFGVPNFLLVLVFLTVFIDAYYGIKKSVKISQGYIRQANNLPDDSFKKKMLLKKADRTRFDPKKLQFTFFKCFTLLVYLYFAKNILEINSEGGSLSELIGFTSGIVAKVPLTIFWYYDFKSIGDNSAFIYGKKAPIFKIVEKLFEPKINKLFNKEQ